MSGFLFLYLHLLELGINFFCPIHKINKNGVGFRIFIYGIGPNKFKRLSSMYLWDCWMKETNLCLTSWWVMALETPEILNVA